MPIFSSFLYTFGGRVRSAAIDTESQQKTLFSLKRLNSARPRFLAF